MSKNPNNTAKKRKTRRGFYPVLFIAVLLLILAAIALCVRLFGRVDMTSSDIGDSGLPASTSSSPATTISGSPVTTAPSETSKASYTEQNTTARTTESEQKHYIQPAGTEWNLKLVNPWNPIDKDYESQINFTTYSGSNKFDSRAVDKLKALVNAGKAHNIRVASLHRTYDHQKRLYNDQVAREMAKGYKRPEAEAIAASVVARPGTSEHNLGLAADLLFENYSSLEESCENTEAYRWMIKHCADYGFILRFPKNKQSVTGVTFEPWHYRYVGEQAAREIMSRGITLEEYLQEKGK